MGAAIATGRYATYEEASEAMTRVARRYEPKLSEAAAYEASYRRWREAAALLGRFRAEG